MQKIFEDIQTEEFEEIKDYTNISDEFIKSVCDEVEFQLERFDTPITCHAAFEILKEAIDLYISEYNELNENREVEPRSMEELVAVAIERLSDDLITTLSNEDLFPQDDSFIPGGR